MSYRDPLPGAKRVTTPISPLPHDHHLRIHPHLLASLGTLPIDPTYFRPPTVRLPARVGDWQPPEGPGANCLPLSDLHPAWPSIHDTVDWHLTSWTMLYSISDSNFPEATEARFARVWLGRGEYTVGGLRGARHHRPATRCHTSSRLEWWVSYLKQAPAGLGT